MVKRRRKPLNLTIEPALRARLDALQAKVPGATLSAICEELMTMSLPAFEAMAEAMVTARRADGQIDEAKARDAMAVWAGAQLLNLGNLQHTPVKGDDES